MRAPVARPGDPGPRIRLVPLALLVVAATLLIRLPTLVYPGPIDDESVYAVVAHEMAHGGRPYIDAVERKPPLLFWTYEGVTRLGGEYNWPALHAAAFAWTFATAAGLFVAGWQLSGAGAGAAAALLYGIFHTWGPWRNYAWNGEALMNLPTIWAWVIAFRRPRSRLRLDLIGAGALAAAAFLLKQPAGIVLVALTGYVLLPAYRTARGVSLADSIVQAMAIGVGFGVTLLATAALLHAQGILYEAFYWTVLDHDVPHVFWAHATLQTLVFAIACLPLLVGTAVTLHTSSVEPAERQALWLFLAVSAIGTAAAGRFYAHYYIQMILPLSLAAAPFFAIGGPPSPASAMARARARLWIGWVAGTAVVFAAIGGIGLHLAPVMTAAGQYVRSNSGRADRMFVWGNRPRIYLDAHRRPACRYIATFPLTGFVFGEPLPGLDTRARINPEAWTNLAADFRHHPPRFIIDMESAQGAQYPIRRFPILASWMAARCDRVAHVAEGDVYECDDRRTAQRSD